MIPFVIVLLFLQFDTSLGENVTETIDTFNAWWICSYHDRIGWNRNSTLSLIFVTIFGVIFGFGLTSLVQGNVSLESRKQLIRAGHFFAGFVWNISLVTCSPWMFTLLVAQTYLYGSEPYDNVFSGDMWRVVIKLWKNGEKVHGYWAISSLLVHLWFVGGAGALALGIERPSWILLGIIGFSCSHIARVFAYDYFDTMASIFEFFGVLILALCLPIEWYTYHTFTFAWLIVSVLERITHLPSAFKRDASWMRSYDLWIQAQEKANVMLSDSDSSVASIELPKIKVES